MIFIISYPILASFGLLLIGVTYIFSLFSRFLNRFRPEGKTVVLKASAWEDLPNSGELLEAKLFKQIVFGPSGFEFRRKDGVPSVLSDYVFGRKVQVLKEGYILEKWNTTESKDLPDFDICLYDPNQDTILSASIGMFPKKLIMSFPLSGLTARRVER